MKFILTLFTSVLLITQLSAGVERPEMIFVDGTKFSADDKVLLETLEMTKSDLGKIFGDGDLIDEFVAEANIVCQEEQLKSALCALDKTLSFMQKSHFDKDIFGDGQALDQNYESDSTLISWCHRCDTDVYGEINFKNANPDDGSGSDWLPR